MKRNIFLVVVMASIVLVSGCNAGTQPSANSTGSSGTSAQITQEQPEQITIKESTDKHTWYIKNYVGMNAASVGYTALDGSRRDAYGAGTLTIVYRTPDGSYLEYAPDDEGNAPEELKNYRVVAQSIAPNTELKYTFMLDENGDEYDNLVSTQSYESIVLAVDEVGSTSKAPDLTALEAAPDKYTRYVKDYVGCNLASVGYVSMAGTYNDHYGSGFITFDITTSDGSYIDPSDVEALKGYVVTAQSVAPNTPITMTFMKQSDGTEFDNLIESQSVESINLTVSPVA